MSTRASAHTSAKKKGGWGQGWINVSCCRFIVNITSHCSDNLYKVSWPHAKKKRNQKQKTICLKIVFSETGGNACHALTFHLFLYKVTIPDIRVPPSCNVMWHPFIRTCYRVMLYHFAERTSASNTSFSEPLAAHFCYFIKGEDKDYGHNNNKAEGRFGKKEAMLSTQMSNKLSASLWDQIQKGPIYSNVVHVFGFDLISRKQNQLYLALCLQPVAKFIGFSFKWEQTRCLRRTNSYHLTGGVFTDQG